jgi:hypothetical protein
MSFTLFTSGSCVRKAGLNANSTIVVSGSAIQDWSDQAEGYIVAVTRRDWVDSYTSVDTHIKEILRQVGSAIVSKEIISYDMSGFTSRAEAQTMLDVQDDTVQRGIAILKDFKSNQVKAVQ